MIKKIGIIFFMVILLTIFLYSNAFADNGTFVSQIVSRFSSETSKYEQIMLKYAKLLFYWCAVLEISWLGIKKVLGISEIGDMIKEFCLILLACGFFLAVINNYQTWVWNIINGLKSVAGEATGIVDAADRPFTIGLDLAKAIFEKTSFFSPTDSIVYILSGMAILFCFALVTMQIILIKCECIVALCASSILVGLGATSFFREYAINTIRYVVSVAFKLMVMYLVIGIGINFFTQLQFAEDNWLQIGVTISFCLIFYCLVKTLPDVVAGIIQGSHVSTGGSLGSTVAAMGAGMMGAGLAAAAGVGNVGRAAQAARMQGAEGIGGMMRGTASNLVQATRQSMHNKDMGRHTVSSMLRERIEAARLENVSKKGGSKE